MDQLTILSLTVGAKFAEIIHVKWSIPGTSDSMTGLSDAKHLSNRILHKIWRIRPKAIQYRDNQYTSW